VVGKGAKVWKIESEMKVVEVLSVGGKDGWCR